MASPFFAIRDPDGRQAKARFLQCVSRTEGSCARDKVPHPGSAA